MTEVTQMAFSRDCKGTNVIVECLNAGEGDRRPEDTLRVAKG